MSAIEEALVATLRELPVGQQQEVLDFAKSLKSKSKTPLRSLEGLWAGQGVDIFEEDIAELRKEMWSGFPREI